MRAGFRAYFEFLLEDPQTFELLRRNAGTIRAMFDEPSLGAGTEELVHDLEAGIAAGHLPDHDVEYMAAAMVGAGFEVGGAHDRARRARPWSGGGLHRADVRRRSACPADGVKAFGGPTPKLYPV